VLTPKNSQSHSAIQARQIAKRYEQGQWILADVSFTISRGESVLLTGENGAGKTTLLRLLAALIRPTRGYLSIFDCDSVEECKQLSGRIGLLTHTNYHYDDLSAYENLRFVAECLGKKNEEPIQKALHEVGLEKVKDKPVRNFSAGMKRRLCFARLLLSTPELLLLDEPFGQLDPDACLWVENYIRHQQERGCTLLIATHDIERGRELCPKQLVLAQGKIQVQER